MRSNQQNFFLDQPSTDFEKVRDGRGSLPLWLDVDLTNARSLGANSALVLNIAGNSFYVDQDTANVGNATVHFQDTNLGASSAPLFVSAGFIANVPFTQILIENTAQAGKRLRIFYGVDIDFQAGINASIAISGSVTLSGNTNAVMIGNAPDYTASYKSITNLAANTAEQIFSAASNVNGALIISGDILTTANAALGLAAFIAKATAPISVIDGDIILGTTQQSAVSTYWAGAGSLRNAVKIPAGKGLYFIANNAEVANNVFRNCLYKLL